MTRDDAPIDRASETAQVVLVGAVAIAFIIVGLVLVANTVLYTESVGAERSLNSADATADFQRLARDETANVVYRVNEGNNFSDPDNLDDNVTSDVSALSNLLAAEYGQRSGVFVNVSVDLSNSEYGARIEQDDEGTFENRTGSSSWDPVSPTNETIVSEFGMTVNVSEMPAQSTFGSNDPFNLTWTASDDTFLYFVNDSGNLSLVERNTAATSVGTTFVDSELSAGDPCRDINVSQTIYVDISAGRVPGTDCTFDAMNEMDSPVSISFDNADNGFGTYSFVVKDDQIASASKYGEFDGTTSDDPYASFVYWRVQSSVEYEGAETSYNLSRQLKIYGQEIPFVVSDDLIVPMDDTTPATDVEYRVNFDIRSGSDTIGNSLNSVEINVEQVTGTTDMFTGTDQSNLTVIGVDKDGDGTIDEDITSDVNGWTVSDSGTTLKIELSGTAYSAQEGHTIIARFDGVTNPDPGRYSVQAQTSGDGNTHFGNITVS